MLYRQISAQNAMQGHGDSRNFQSLKQSLQHTEENGLCKFAFVDLTAKSKKRLNIRIIVLHLLPPYLARQCENATSRHIVYHFLSSSSWVPGCSDISVLYYENPVAARNGGEPMGYDQQGLSFLSAWLRRTESGLHFPDR